VAILYGILPHAWPQFLAYALYRWEVNIRAAAVLGFVGAGGLGQRIHIAISLFPSSCSRRIRRPTVADGSSP
jgi:phosphonate transport system permease protein